MPLCLRSLTLILSLMVIRKAGIRLEVYLHVTLTLGKGGAMGDGIPDVLQSSTSSPSPSFIVQVSTLSKFLDQWRSITSNRFVLNVLKGHHLQHRCCLPQFNIRAALTRHPIIQEEVDWLLAKGAIEPSTGGA